MSLDKQRQETFQYYDEVATEYDEFYKGSGQASITIPALYEEEARQVATLLPDYIAGDHIDLACGTCFWLPHYHARCSQIILFDQSEKMLRRGSLRVSELGIAGKTKIIRGDILTYSFQIHKYDSALVGLLIGHFNDVEESQFFDILKGTIKPNGKFVIIESAWSDERAAVRPKASVQKRNLGRRKFEVFKKYFTEKDFENLSKKFKIRLEIVQSGKVFITAVGMFTNPTV